MKENIRRAAEVFLSESDRRDQPQQVLPSSRVGGNSCPLLKRYQIDLSQYILGRGDWKSRLGEQLGEGYEIVKPEIPCRWNAKYPEWQIWFEKFIPYLNDGVILIGHSLGGTFLAKYLAENKFPKRIKGVFLVAAPFDDTPDEALVDFSLPKSLKGLENQAEKTFLYHSSDDPVVPFSHLAKYAIGINNAMIKEFTDRGHFNQEEFPELLEDIKNLN